MKQVKYRKKLEKGRSEAFKNSHIFFVLFLVVVGCIVLYGISSMTKNNETIISSKPKQVPSVTPQQNALLLPTRSTEDVQMTFKTGKFFRLAYPSSWFEYTYGRGLPPDTVEVFEVHNTPQFEDDESKPQIWLTVEISEKPETITQKEALINQLNAEYTNASKTGYQISRELLQNNTVLVWERLEKDRYEKKYYLVKDKGYVLSFTINIPNGFSSSDVKNFYIEDLNKILPSFQII